MGLILRCRVFFGCVWYGLRSSGTCFYIDASDSLLRVQERAVLVDNRKTHRTRRMPCAYSFRSANLNEKPLKNGVSAEVVLFRFAALTFSGGRD